MQSISIPAVKLYNLGNNSYKHGRYPIVSFFLLWSIYYWVSISQNCWPDTSWLWCVATWLTCRIQLLSLLSAPLSPLPASPSPAPCWGSCPATCWGTSSVWSPLLHSQHIQAFWQLGRHGGYPAQSLFFYWAGKVSPGWIILASGMLPRQECPATAFLKYKNTYLDISLLSASPPVQILNKATQIRPHKQRKQYLSSVTSCVLIRVLICAQYFKEKINLANQLCKNNTIRLNKSA